MLRGWAAIRNAGVTSRTGLWFIVVFVAGVFLVIISQSGALDPVRNLGVRLASPFTSALDSIAGGISGQDGQSAIESELEQLQVEIAGLRAQAGRVAELEQALQFTQSQTALGLLPAEVIQRRSGNFEDILAIDRGSSDGLVEDMAVLSANGSLVGIIVETFPDYAWVRLITDPALSVDALIQGVEGGTGVVQGDGANPLSLELVPKEANGREGDTVVTSGLTGRFPEGLLIGTISSVSQSDELFLRIAIEPAANLGSFELVMVVTSPLPRELEPPE
ncbi:MAG: rod shape-determining protein MreC [Dehalococcoidia bacterium]|nr:rod shape-determining protein MreC [Dehalococcoidia bacterium]